MVIKVHNPVDRAAYSFQKERCLFLSKGTKRCFESEKRLGGSNSLMTSRPPTSSSKHYLIESIVVTSHKGSVKVVYMRVSSTKATGTALTHLLPLYSLIYMPPVIP